MINEQQGLNLASLTGFNKMGWTGNTQTVFQLDEIENIGVCVSLLAHRFMNEGAHL